MELNDLVGIHTLTGVDINSVRVDTWGFGDFETTETISFTLDGVTYTAVEDPNDGYRSCMKKLFVGGEVQNKFAPVIVKAGMKKKNKHDDDDPDILELVDAFTKEVILSVGTSYSDSYYPTFVCNFQPEKMCVNKEKTDV